MRNRGDGMTLGSDLSPPSQDPFTRQNTLPREIRYEVPSGPSASRSALPARFGCRRPCFGLWTVSRRKPARHFVPVTDYDDDASSVCLPLILEGLRFLPVKPAFECVHCAGDIVTSITCLVSMHYLTGRHVIGKNDDADRHKKSFHVCITPW
jgi:hypothetical protein